MESLKAHGNEDMTPTGTQDDEGKDLTFSSDTALGIEGLDVNTTRLSNEEPSLSEMILPLEVSNSFSVALRLILKSVKPSLSTEIINDKN